MGPGTFKIFCMECAVNMHFVMDWEIKHIFLSQKISLNGGNVSFNITERGKHKQQQALLINLNSKLFTSKRKTY